MNNTKFALFAQFIGFLGLKLCKLNKQSKLCKLFLFCFLLFALFCLPLSLEAKVTGVCSNCHTMHNSQNGAHMQYLASGETDTNPKGLLLRGTCFGCHGQGTAQNIITNGNIPQVRHTNTTDLAGGHFRYLDTDDNRGHNVIDTGNQEGTAAMFPPPGDQHSTGITATNFTCSGAKGCHGDRSVADKFLSIKGAHHTDDAVLKFGSINLSGQGGSTGLSYRFLKGVKGGEDTDWQATSGTTDHNEYFGDTTMSASSATVPAGNTISGLCAECHGNYHGTTASEAGSASPWYRHPTDTSLPATGEYATYTSYSFTAPVARTQSWSGWGSGGSASGTVGPSGNTDDIVMCLSCHRAHASPYFKMMRWDYKGWPGTGGTNGCNVCHTSKN